MEENLNVCSLSERWINKLWFSHEMEFHSELSRNKTLTLENKTSPPPCQPPRGDAGQTQDLGYMGRSPSL